MALVMFFLSFVFTVQAQKPDTVDENKTNFVKVEKPEHTHESFTQYDREIGVMHVQVTEKTEEKLFWDQPFALTINDLNKYLFYTEETIFPKKFKVGDCYEIHYCKFHNIAYQLDKWDCSNFRKYRY